MSEIKQSFFCATFHSFKPSGKWYASGRGVMDAITFGSDHRLELILNLYNGRWPGLKGSGREFVRIVILDDGADFGYPLMFPAEE